LTEKGEQAYNLSCGGKQKKHARCGFAVCGGAILIRIFDLSGAKMKNPFRLLGQLLKQ